MKKRSWFIGLIIFALLLFTPFLRNFVREVIIIPFLYLAWIARFFFDAIPQNILWTAFFLLCLLIFASSLFEKRKRRKAGLIISQEQAGRILAWTELLEKAKGDEYFKWRLAQHLQKLALNAIAHQKDQTIKQTRRQLKQGDLDLPPEVQAYFEASLRSLGHLSQRRTFFRTKTVTESPLNLDPTHIIYFLETLNLEGYGFENQELES